MNYKELCKLADSADIKISEVTEECVKFIQSVLVGTGVQAYVTLNGLNHGVFFVRPDEKFLREFEDSELEGLSYQRGEEVSNCVVKFPDRQAFKKFKSKLSESALPGIRYDLRKSHLDSYLIVRKIPVEYAQEIYEHLRRFCSERNFDCLEPTRVGDQWKYTIKL